MTEAKQKKKRAFVRSVLSMAVMENVDVVAGAWLIHASELREYMRHHGLRVSNIAEPSDDD